MRRLELKESAVGVWAIYDSEKPVYSTGISVKYKKPDLMFVRGKLFVYLESSDVIFLECIDYASICLIYSKVITESLLVKFNHLTRGMDNLQKVQYIISTM